MFMLYNFLFKVVILKFINFFSFFRINLYNFEKSHILHLILEKMDFIIENFVNLNLLNFIKNNIKNSFLNTNFKILIYIMDKFFEVFLISMDCNINL